MSNSKLNNKVKRISLILMALAFLFLLIATYLRLEYEHLFNTAITALILDSYAIPFVLLVLFILMPDKRFLLCAAFGFAAITPILCTLFNIYSARILSIFFSATLLLSAFILLRNLHIITFVVAPIILNILPILLYAYNAVCYIILDYTEDGSVYLIPISYFALYMEEILLFTAMMILGLAALSANTGSVSVISASVDSSAPSMPVYTPPAFDFPTDSAPSSPAPRPSVSRKGTPEEKLLQIKDLLEKGLITQDEYDAKREEIISKI